MEDKIYTLYIICVVVFFGGLFLIVLGAAIEESTKEKIGEEEVKCFDRFSNEIEGLVCYEDVYSCGWISENIFRMEDCS